MALDFNERLQLQKIVVPMLGAVPAAACAGGRRPASDGQVSVSGFDGHEQQHRPGGHARGSRITDAGGEWVHAVGNERLHRRGNAATL